MRRSFVLCLGLLLLDTAEVSASGSVSITVVTPSYSLTVEQMFRRRLPRGNTTYYANVRKRFIKIAGGLHAPLKRFIKRRAARKIKKLGKGGWGLNTAICGKERCALDKVVFPAVVSIHGMTKKNSGGTAYSVGLLFKKRPKAKALKWLRGELQKLVETHGGKQDFAGVEVERLGPTVVAAKQLEVQLTPLVYTRKADRKKLAKELVKLAGEISKQATKAAKKTRGVRLGKHKKSLKPYGKDKKLPGTVFAYHRHARLQVRIVVAVKKLKNDAAVNALRTALEAVAKRQ